MKIGIIGKLLIAMIVGIVIGLLAPSWCIRVLNSFGGTFGQFIKFFVPFIIVGLVTPAIAESGKGAGKLLLVTMAVAYISTLLSGAYAFCVSDFVFPRILETTLGSLAETQDFPAYFIFKIPPLMGVTTALAVAFIFGLAMVSLNLSYLKNVFDEIRSAVVLTLAKALMPLLPVYILAIIADLTASGKLIAVGEKHKLLAFPFLPFKSATCNIANNCSKHPIIASLST